MRYVCIAVLVTLASCGQKNEVVVPTPAPGPVPPPVVVTFDQVAPVIAANCGPCHNGDEEPAFTSAAVFKASSAKGRIKAGTMPPPPRTLSAGDKATLLSFLGG